MSRRANGEGTIYQRKDGRWVASLSVGKMKRKHFLGRSRSEVATKLAEALSDQHNGTLVITSNQTLAQYLDNWLASVKNSVRPRTYESYDLNVRRLKPLLGKYRLNSLTPAMVERTYGALLEGGLSRRSIVQVHTVLHNAMKKAQRWRLVGTNPTEAVSVPRPEHHEMQALDEDEVRRLFVTTRGDDLHALWVLLSTTGLRLGEALGLKWADVDFLGQRLVVRRALQRQHGNGLAFVEPKTTRSRRTVYFPVGTCEALREHRRVQVEERLESPLWDDQDLVLCRHDGSPLEPANVSKLFHRSLEKAGLKRIRIHDLRHTAATLQLARGENPKVVQEMLGHSTIAVTMDIYSHVTPAMHQAAASRMQTLFG